MNNSTIVHVTEVVHENHYYLLLLLLCLSRMHVSVHIAVSFAREMLCMTTDYNVNGAGSTNEYKLSNWRQIDALK